MSSMKEPPSSSGGREGAVTTESMTRGTHHKRDNADETDHVSPDTKRSKTHDDDDTKQSSSVNEKDSVIHAPTPAYGSQSYWEDRYRRQFRDTDESSQQVAVADTLAYHAWYFTYADLRPLILPLILGGRNDVQILLRQAEEEENDAEEDEDDMDEKDDDEESISEENDKEMKQQNTDSRTDSSDKQRADPLNYDERPINSKAEQFDTLDRTNDGKDDKEEEKAGDDDSFVEVDEDEEEDDDDEDDDDVEREGLAKAGPISVIEIGCGDVPLGSGLALELKELQKGTGETARTIVKQILCTDYSPTVIETMRSKYNRFDGSSHRPADAADIGDIPLEFEVADARKTELPSRSFELILEKGTLDAMLSDKQDGVSNCVAIMRECARILSLHGYILLVSHLNAHTDRGRGWLRDVVFEGLNGGDIDASWTIEVHGNAEVRDDLPGVPPNSPGPAVYIIRKRPKESTSEADENSTIPVKFYSY